MSQITLKPLDDGQKAVEIPLGKTTIGRGALLGCFDKKVSRNHAVLEVTSKGEVFLTPTHVNPCFYQPTADSPGQILKKDVPHKLENGDSFSLLPRAYRYQLIVEGEPSQKEKTDQNEAIKQVGKTNGSVSSDLLNDGAATNEEIGDTSNTIVPEKTFNKEEGTNVDKISPKEENTFSKKIAEIKDNNVTGENSESPEKCTSPANGADQIVPELDPSLPVSESKAETKDEEKGEPETISAEKPHSDDSSDEGYADAEEKSESLVSKTIDSSDQAPKTEVAEKDNKDEKNEEKETAEKSPEPEITDKNSSPFAEPDDEEEEDEDSNDPQFNEIVTKVSAPEKISLNIKIGKRTTITTRKPRKEKQTPKRKADTESSPKRRGRKKKTNFDDAQEGTSRTPGRTSSRTNRQTRQGLSLEDFIVSDDDEWQSDRSESKPRRKRGRRRGDDSGSDWEIDHKKPKKQLLHKVWSGSESGNEQFGQKKKKGPKGRRKKVKSQEEVNENLSDEEEEEAPASSPEEKVDKLRIPCTYGKKCYRRSTNHKDQFSHPGDSDYTSEPETNQKKNEAISDSDEEMEAPPKKECPYGANCFRKNAQHKKDFKHTKIVRPKREAAKQADKKAKNSRNGEEVDSYDLNDSFLNDDSADEYRPADSGSDYESGEKTKKVLKVKGGRRGRGKKL